GRGIRTDAPLVLSAGPPATLLGGEAAPSREPARLPLPCAERGGPAMGRVVAEDRDQIPGVRRIRDVPPLAVTAGEVRAELPLGRRAPDPSPAARAARGRKGRAVRRERDRRNGRRRDERSVTDGLAGPGVPEI